MYIVRPNLSDEEIAPILERINNYIATLGGQVKEVIQTSPWGRRRMAYNIENFQDGYYVVTNLLLSPTQASELERSLRLSDDILRHILVRPDSVEAATAPPVAAVEPSLPQ
jgi:small subunit ribosomal protein S6